MVEELPKGPQPSSSIHLRPNIVCVCVCVCVCLLNKCNQVVVDNYAYNFIFSPHLPSKQEKIPLNFTIRFSILITLLQSIKDLSKLTNIQASFLFHHQYIYIHQLVVSSTFHKSFIIENGGRPLVYSA
jgi:hypothetical protein